MMEKKRFVSTEIDGSDNDDKKLREKLRELKLLASSLDTSLDSRSLLDVIRKPSNMNPGLLEAYTMFTDLEEVQEDQLGQEPKFQYRLLQVKRMQIIFKESQCCAL